jgi:hypothetical protein
MVFLSFGLSADSNRFQILDQVVPLLIGQPQFENIIVAFDDVGQGREPAVMVEPTSMCLLLGTLTSFRE